MKKKRFFPDCKWSGIKKLLLIMKLTTLLLFLSVMTFASRSYSQNIHFNLSVKDASIIQVFDEIERVTDFGFLFKTDQLDLNKRYTLDIKNTDVNRILNTVLDKDQYSFRIVERTIVITKNNPGKLWNEAPSSVRGKVTDANGQALPGVTVVIKGTNRGTVTDTDGNYSLTGISSDATLVFSFVGMRQQEIEIGGKSKVDVVMQEESIGLNEVVAIGYGTQKKVNLTGSIATVDETQITESPQPNLSNKLAGLLPGVIVNSRSGAPGDDDATIYIRGKGTLGNTDALVVIDGVPSDDGFSRLNPEDIESFSVLKDASAAIYGARAANGVILITTKRGKEGKTRFTFKNNVGWSQPTRMSDLLNSWQYATVENEYCDNFSGAAHKWTDEEIQKFKDGSSPLAYPSTDWLDILFKDWTMQSNHTLSASGGNNTVSYYLSGQYLSQKGPFENGNFPYQQFQWRSNLDIQLTKSLSLKFDMSFRKQKRHDPPAGSYSSIMSNAKSAYPYLVAYYPNGLPGKGLQDSEPNLAVATSKEGGLDRKVDNIVDTKVNFQWQSPVKGLKMSGFAVYNAHFYNRKNFVNYWDEYTYDESTGEYELVESGIQRNLTVYKNDWTTSTYHVQVDYANSFGDHNIDAFVAAEQSHYDESNLSAYRQGFTSDLLQELFAGDVNDALTNYGSEDASGRVNYFGRVNYNFRSKYLASFTLRYDGSQNFPKGHRFGAFPGVSVGWRLSEEPFLKDNPSVNYLKIRASWGKMGNDNVDPYQYLGSYQYPDYNSYGWGVQTGYAFGDDVTYVAGLEESTLPNTNITWETANTFNVGLDANFFHERLTLVLDAFRSKRTGILIERTESVPEYTGMSLPDENLGIVVNKGLEAQLSFRGEIAGGLKYTAGGNLSFVRNKVKYMDEAVDTPDYQKTEGYPIDSWVLYKADGLFQTQEEVDNYPHLNGTGPGDVKLVDVNGDKEISEKDQVRKKYGITPEIVYGINAGLTWKNFNLSVLFQGQSHALLNIKPSLNYNPAFFYGRWQKEGDNRYPRVFRDMNSGSGPSNYNSTFWLRKANFIRLKNVNLSYSIPERLLKPVFLSGAKFYLAGSNLFTIDKIKYFDPESSSGSGLGYYPIQRTFSIGLDLTL